MVRARTRSLRRRLEALISAKSFSAEDVALAQRESRFGRFPIGNTKLLETVVRLRKAMIAIEAIQRGVSDSNEERDTIEDEFVRRVLDQMGSLTVEEMIMVGADPKQFIGMQDHDLALQIHLEAIEEAEEQAR